MMSNFSDIDEEEKEKKGKRKVNRLTQIEPPIISVVTRGANRKNHILKQKQEGDMPEPQLDEFGNEIEIEAEEGSTNAGEASPAEGTEKADMMPPGVKARVAETLTSIVERAKSLLSKVQGIGTDEKAPKPIPSSVEQEIKSISAAANGILEKYPAPQSSMAPEKEDEPESGTEAKEETSKGESTLTKRDVKALRKLFVNFGKLMKLLDPDAKKALKEDGILLKHDEPTKPQADQQSVQIAELTTQIAELKKQVDEKSTKIAKLNSQVPNANSVLYPVTPTEKDNGEYESDFKFGWSPEQEETKEGN